MSSDKKTEGEDFVGHIPVNIGEGCSITVNTSGAEVVELTVPVMYLDSRFSTLVARYWKLSKM